MHASHCTDVAIIGGGPCGLATAHALAKVLPTSTITLLEKAPTLTMPRGAGLGLAVNGLKALRAINPAALDAVVQRSTTSRMMESRSVQGAVLKVRPHTAQAHSLTRHLPGLRFGRNHRPVSMHFCHRVKCTCHNDVRRSE